MHLGTDRMGVKLANFVIYTVPIVRCQSIYHACNHSHTTPKQSRPNQVTIIQGKR